MERRRARPERVVIVEEPEDDDDVAPIKELPLKRVKLSLFTPAKTPEGAIVLFDPVQVEHRSGKAKLVTTPYHEEANVEVLKDDLQPLTFEGLDDEQQTWMLERVCACLCDVVERNASSVAAVDAAAIAALMTDAAGAVAGRLFHKGEALKALARNAAVLAGFKALRDLPAQEAAAAPLATIITEYGVDLSVGSLRRYAKAGGLMARCPALLFGGNMRMLMLHGDIVGKMLDNADHRRRLDGIWQRCLLLHSGKSPRLPS